MYLVCLCRLREVETHCGDTYAAYKKALKKNWHQIDEVRKEQAAFESCWREYKQYNKVRRAFSLSVLSQGVCVSNALCVL